MEKERRMVVTDTITAIRAEITAAWVDIEIARDRLRIAKERFEALLVEQERYSKEGK